MNFNVKYKFYCIYWHALTKYKGYTIDGHGDTKEQALDNLKSKIRRMITEIEKPDKDSFSI